MAAGVAGSYAQMVCDNEIAAYVGGWGFVADQDALAVEVIAAVMGGSRNFLDQRHTVRYLRAGEVLYTHLAERRPPFIPPDPSTGLRAGVGGERGGEWERTGRADMAERAQAEAERLLAEHEVSPLTEDQERELAEIMQQAERELVSG